MPTPILDSLNYRSLYPISPGSRVVPKHLRNDIVTMVTDVAWKQGVYRISSLFPDNFDWSLENQAGRLTRRISANLARIGAKASPELLSSLGNVINRGALKEGPVKRCYDFNRSLRWRGGKFDDGYSCFWEDNRDALTELRRRKAAAIRLWEDQNTNPNMSAWGGRPTFRSRRYDGQKWWGAGRAWIVEDDDRWPGSLILFNAYGPLQLHQFGAVLANHLNLAWWDIKLRNFGISDAMLYINGGNGLMVGPLKATNSHATIDLMWVTRTSYCSICDDPLSRKRVVVINNRIYCPSCAKEAR